MKTLAAVAILFVAGLAPDLASAAADPLRAALEESRASGKGLTFYVNGQAIAGAVVAVEDGYVVARSQAQGSIVIRLDRIDGVAGFVPLPGGERKGQ